MDDIVLDSTEVKGLQSIDVSQSRNDFKSCNLSDSTNMISKRPFGEDVTVSTSDLEAEGTSIVGNNNNVLNYQLSFQSQNDDVGTEEVTGIGDGTISARTLFSCPVHGDSDLLGPHLHGTIATSTQIPYYGSTSFQSESSTPRTRSFALAITDSNLHCLVVIKRALN
ncbi:hypothetical protein KSP39_PZI016792 [Platanthera zijinensis]|uniref:Uncharacterized protein n=1 Tax=Platanthera zijinensis TaxID=2320716 RepID=A0AAP0B666_9ASPA